MDVSLQAGQKVPFSVLGTDAAGNPTTTLAAGASLAVVISDVTVATVAADPTPASGSIASGVLTALKAGTTALTASITNADGTPGPTVSANVTVTAAGPGPVANLQITFGVTQ